MVQLLGVLELQQSLQDLVDIVSRCAQDQPFVYTAHRSRVTGRGWVRLVVEVVSLRKVRLADQFYRRSHTSWGQRLGGGRLIQRHQTTLACTTTTSVRHASSPSRELQTILRGSPRSAVP